jgi:hypothetical protein
VAGALCTTFLGAGLAATCTAGAGMGESWGWDGVTGVGLLELTGFGLSLEQPTVTEQTISTAAKISAPVFLPQVATGLPQARERVSAMVRIALIRVIGLPPAAERHLAECTMEAKGEGVDSARVRAVGLKHRVGRGTRCGRGNTLGGCKVSRFQGCKVSKTFEARVFVVIGESSCLKCATILRRDRSMDKAVQTGRAG